VPALYVEVRCFPLPRARGHARAQRPEHPAQPAPSSAPRLAVCFSFVRTA